jgi:hypothetical protein
LPLGSVDEGIVSDALAVFVDAVPSVVVTPVPTESSVADPLSGAVSAGTPSSLHATSGEALATKAVQTYRIVRR